MYLDDSIVKNLFDSELRSIKLTGSLNSIMDQSYNDWKLTIFDKGTNVGRLILSKFSDPRINLLESTDDVSFSDSIGLLKMYISNSSLVKYHDPTSIYPVDLFSELSRLDDKVILVTDGCTKSTLKLDDIRSDLSRLYLPLVSQLVIDYNELLRVDSSFNGLKLDFNQDNPVIFWLLVFISSDKLRIIDSEITTKGTPHKLSKVESLLYRGILSKLGGIESDYLTRLDEMYRLEYIKLLSKMYDME